MNLRTADTCPYCIDGIAPAGIHPILGPIYVRCFSCISTAILRICTGCNDEAIFPATPRCLHCLDEHLATRGLTAAFCHDCLGIVAILPRQDTQ